MDGSFIVLGTILFVLGATCFFCELGNRFWKGRKEKSTHHDPST